MNLKKLKVAIYYSGVRSLESTGNSGKVVAKIGGKSYHIDGDDIIGLCDLTFTSNSIMSLKSEYFTEVEIEMIDLKGLKKDKKDTEKEIVKLEKKVDELDAKIAAAEASGAKKVKKKATK